MNVFNPDQLSKMSLELRQVAKLCFNSIDTTEIAIDNGLKLYKDSKPSVSAKERVRMYSRCKKEFDKITKIVVLTPEKRRLITTKKLSDLSKKVIISQMNDWTGFYQFSFKISPHGNCFEFTIYKGTMIEHDICQYNLRASPVFPLTQLQEIEKSVQDAENLFSQYSKLNKEKKCL